MNKQNIELLWKSIRDPNLKTMMDALGIEITALEKDYIRATMPVDHRTIQYYGRLHGGASVALAETLASVGACVHVDMEKEIVVGLEINANHIRGATAGQVVGEGRPLHIGKKTQVWQMEMKNEEGKLLCISRCTIAVVPKP